MNSSKFVIIVFFTSTLVSSFILFENNGGNGDRVTSKGAPTISTSLPRIVNVELGKSLEITCSASGRPLPEVMWLVDDVPVSSKLSDNYLEPEFKNSLYIGSTESLLRIPCVGGKLHMAKLTCRAVNINGVSEDISTRIFVDDNNELSVNSMDIEFNCGINKIDRMPVITEWTKFRMELIRQSMTLKCRSSLENAKVHWSHGSGIAISGDNFKVLPNGDLQINKLQSSYMGDFKCRFSNDFGSDEKSIFVYPTTESG